MPSLEQIFPSLSIQTRHPYFYLLTSSFQDFEREISVQTNLLQNRDFIRALFELDVVTDPIEKIWFIAHHYPATFPLFFPENGELSNTLLHKIIIRLEGYSYVPHLQIAKILTTIVQFHEGKTEYPFVNFLNRKNHEGRSAAQILSEMIENGAQVSPRTEERLFAHFLQRVTARSFMQANPTLPPRVTEEFIASKLAHCRRESERRLEHNMTIEDGEESFYGMLRAGVLADLRGDAWTASLQQLLATLMRFGATI